MDSTGVPHILEHTTLCGSKKFPCRDPFFKMLNRSLSTFMNAWTGKMSSPFESQIFISTSKLSVIAEIDVNLFMRHMSAFSKLIKTSGSPR